MGDRLILPEWTRVMNRMISNKPKKDSISKKELKKALAYYGMTKYEAYLACDAYVKLMKYDAPKIYINFAHSDGKIDYLGKKVTANIYWGVACMMNLIYSAAMGQSFYKGLHNLEKQYTRNMAESRINVYGHDMRQNAMSLYYRDRRNLSDDDDGCSKLLHPNEALELAALFASYLLTGVSIKDFAENGIKLEFSWIGKEEKGSQMEKDYYAIVKWIVTKLWVRFHEIQDKVASDLLEIINRNDENRRRAVFMLVFYLIGFNDLDGDIIYAAGDVPEYEEGEIWILKMKQGIIL